MYCNFLLSIKAACLEVKKYVFAVATLVPMFTIITPGPYTCSQKSKLFHAKFNLEVNCQRMPLITKGDCMSVTDLNQRVRHLGQVVEVFPILPDDFHENCLFNMSDQLVVKIVFSRF